MQEEKEVKTIAEIEAYSNQSPSSFESNKNLPKKSNSENFYAEHTSDLITESSKTEGLCKENNQNTLHGEIRTKRDHKWHSWKVSDASIDHLSENLKANFPKFYRKEIDTLLDNAVSDETLEIVCLISAYTINNYFGSPSQKGVDENELISYLYRLTPLGTEKVKENLEKAKCIRAPEFMLHVNIIEACNVQHNPSKISGYPFCKLWVSSNPHHTVITGKGNEYNNPIWNAHFYVTVRDPKKDFLCIEVWDNFEKEVLESEARCVLCSKIFCCGCELKPCPIGRVDVKINDLFMDGTDEWLSIKSRKRKIERGKLRIKAYFGVVAAKTKTNAFKRHMLLIKVCVLEGINQIIERESTGEDLDEILETTGQTLIHLHCVMSSLSACENSVCKLIVVNRIRTANDSIQLKIMYQLLTETCDCLNQDCLADAVEIQLKGLYTKEVQILHDRCFNFLNSLHSFDLANDPGKLNEFKYSLKCIHICEEVLLIESAPLKTLKMEASDWIESEEETLNELEPQLKLEYLIELLRNLIGFHKAADSVIQTVIPHETYTNITFNSLADLCDAVKNIVVSFSMSFLSSAEDTDVIEKGIQLYSQIKFFAEYVLNKTKTPRTSWKMREFQSWFNDILIEGWFKRRKEIAVQLMKNAVTDSFQKRLHDSELQTDNIVEVLINILDKYLTSLWHLLSHSESFGFYSMYLNAIHEYCLQYYETARELIENQSLPQNHFHQYVLDLCILANNLWKLSIEIKKILRNIGKIPSISVETYIVLKFFCETVCKDVSQILIGELDEPLNQIVMAETLENQSMAIDAYEKYCTNVIQDYLVPNTEKEVYIILKQKLWTRILDFINDYMEKFKAEIRIKEEQNDKEKTGEAEKKDIFFRGLFKILTLSKHFCFADEKNEILDYVENESYTKLVEEIGKYVSQYQ